MPSSIGQRVHLSKALKPLHREIDPDDAPIFKLTDAIIRDKNENMTSLFLAKQKFELTVTGRLVYDPEQSDCFLSRQKYTPITYPEVVSFAFDDNLNVWTFTNYGWLQIVKSAREYEGIHLSMKQAVELWFYIQDRQEKPWSVKEWAKNFASNNRARGMSTSDVEKALAMSADFIYQEMKKSISVWDRTEIYRYMKAASTYAGASRKQKKIVVHGPIGAAATPDTKKRGRPRKLQETEPVAEGTALEEEETLPKEVELLNNQKTDAAILWKLLRVKCTSWKMDEAIKLVYAYFQFDSERTANIYLNYQAENLLKYLRQGKYAQSHLYKELSKATISARMTGKMASIGLRARDEAKRNLLSEDIEFHESTDEELAPTISLLRPKKSGKTGKRYTKGQDAASESDDDTDVSQATGSKRRKTRDSDSDYDAKRQGVKDGQKSLPLRYKEDGIEEDEGLVPLLVKSYPIDLSEIDENGTWACNQPDCLHNVYGADSALGQELITMHMEEHEEEKQAEQAEVPEFGIVKREMQATHLPVNNLLKRIREFTMARNLANVIAGAERPESSAPTGSPIQQLFA